MTNPKVSIILTTHEGRKDRCERAIHSVLEQSFSDWQLIVVDDASQDGTSDMVLGYRDKDPRIGYLRREVNFGNDTRPKNEGIMLSIGDYIGFLDSDNTYRPDHLAILVKTLDENSEIDVVYGDRFVTDDVAGKSLGLGTHSDFNHELLYNQNFIDTGDVLVRRHCLFAVGGFDERYKKYVDWNLWLRLYKYGYNFTRVPMIISDYHIGKDAKSLRKEDEKGFSQPAWDPIELEVELPYLEEKMPPRVAIFTLTYDRLLYTKESFESLHKTAGYKFDHYVVDNGSKDGTAEWLKEYEAEHKGCVTVIYNKDNKGIAIGSNQALEKIRENGKKYAVVGKFDNDAYCKTQGWLAKIIELWQKNHRLILSCYISGLKDTPGGAPRLGYGMIGGEMIGITRHLGGICCFSSSDLRLGFHLKEDSALHTLDDWMFSQAVVRKGYIMGYLENYFISHGPGGTSEQYDDYPAYFERRKVEVAKSYEKSK